MATDPSSRARGRFIKEKPSKKKNQTDRCRLMRQTGTQTKHTKQKKLILVCVLCFWSIFSRKTYIRHLTWTLNYLFKHEAHRLGLIILLCWSQRRLNHAFIDMQCSPYRSILFVTPSYRIIYGESIFLEVLFDKSYLFMTSNLPRKNEVLHPTFASIMD